MNTFVVFLLYLMLPKYGSPQWRYWYRKRYLKSNHWRRVTKRKKMLQFACEECKTQKRLDTHHKNYKHLFWEWMSDLQVLCRSCHERVHNE